MKIPTQFPVEVIGKAGNAKIRRKIYEKGGKEYTSFIVDYILAGKRVQTARADFAEAHGEATEAVAKMANEESLSTLLVNGERFAYLRAVESAAAIAKPMDEVCREFVSALDLLGGRITVLEACRDWMNRNASIVEKITVRAAMEKMLAELESDGKSFQERIHIKGAITAFADALQINVDLVTPEMVDRHLAGLDLAKRTKANRRDRIKAFNGWLVLKKFLPKGTDWLEGVKKYSRAKEGEVEVFTPDEMGKLLKVAGEMTPFLALAAFAGIRHATIVRMDWSMIDLNEYVADGIKWAGCIKVPGKIGKNKTRYLVPIHENLKAWLLPFIKKSGLIFPQLEKLKLPALYTTVKLSEVAAAAGIAWKRNALRHSFVSYRLAECHDIMRVSRESNNSANVIQTNYEQAVTSAAAVEWFNLKPVNMPKK